MQSKDIYQRYNTCTIKRFKVQSSKFKVQCSKFSVQSSVFKVQCSKKKKSDHKTALFLKICYLLLFNNNFCCVAVTVSSYCAEVNTACKIVNNDCVATCC